MKFSITVGRSCGRQGTLSNFVHQQDATFQTPLCLIATKFGCVPHLTTDTLERVVPTSPQPLPLLVPLNYAVVHHDALKEYGKGVAEFMGLKEAVVFGCVQSPTEETPTGHNCAAGVATFSTHGVKKVTAERYMDLESVILPDVFPALSDGDTDQQSSKKRVIKSTRKTREYLFSCVNLHEKNKVLYPSAMLNVCVGGYNSYNRADSMETCNTVHPAAGGLLIDGLHKNGDTAHTVTIDNVNSILPPILRSVSTETPKFMYGGYLPSVVVASVMLGVDVFDSSYPVIAADRNCALTFHYILSNSPPSSEDNLKLEDCLKDLKLDDTDVHLNYEIDLSDKRYLEEFTPLLRGCTCYTCTNYTRSYIHHLCTADEMLRYVLLMIHNLHHYLRFFDAIRESIRKDCTSQLLQLLLQPKVQAALPAT